MATSGRVRPEILAPAGDEASLDAAIRAGADAVYFGLQGFNARGRAKNFDAAQLASTMEKLHRHGVRGYVTLNTLVFDDELEQVASAVRACAGAGADAVIVQDFGVLRIARAIAPDMPVHASTQMTCTDTGAIDLAASLGASRVIVARELSIDEIAQIRASTGAWGGGPRSGPGAPSCTGAWGGGPRSGPGAPSCTDVELEVFVHGALCVAYSGQCLTSEAFGGRSANRGACAQACRLPYSLVVDGEMRDLGDDAYLLSPEDLEASRLVPRLVDLGVAALKIEGRLKGPEYVAATVRLYRAAVDAAFGEATVPEREIDDRRRAALQMYSRGSGTGFLEGVNHQRLVEGRACDHRGTEVGTLKAIGAHAGKRELLIRTTSPLVAGHGILVEGGREGKGEIGGRVWTARPADPSSVWVWLGPEVVIPATMEIGRRVWKTSDPTLERQVLAEVTREPRRIGLDVAVTAHLGQPITLEARTEQGTTATVTSEALVLERPGSAPLASVMSEKLGRLGDTPFFLRDLRCDAPAGAFVPVSAINAARRALVDRLLSAAARSHRTTEVRVDDLTGAAVAPDRAPPPPGLFVLCRRIDQAHAAIDAGAEGVIIDFLELAGTGQAVRALRDRNAPWVGVAPPRIRKPGEEKIDRYLASLAPDAIFVRSLGALRDLRLDGKAKGPLAIGDFSLNVTNRLSAHEVLSRGLDVFTPSFDLDAEQLSAMLRGPFGPFAEVVVHHPMPLFHMEHCVIARWLSDGKDHRDCGRPCDRHQVSLRDRAGLDHPVEADVGCRNTVFHAAPQSAAEVVPAALSAGVRRFRAEMIRETPAEVARVVEAYRALISGALAPREVFRRLRTGGGVGVVRGSLRVLTD